MNRQRIPVVHRCANQALPEFAPLRAARVDFPRETDLLVVHVLICAVAYALTWRAVFFELCLLPEASYHSGSIALGMLSHVPTLVLLLIGVLPLFVFRRRITWEEIDDSMKMRNFVWIVASVMGVTFIFSDYNYYYDHTFLVDRLILLALLVLVRVHPGFLFPFVVTLMAFALQIHHPLPDAMWNWPDKRMPMHVLFALVGFVYLRIVVRTDSRLPIVLAIFVAAATYAHAGLSKMAIGPSLTTWLLENPTSNIFVSAHLQGNWLGQLSESTVVSIAGFLRRIDIATNGYTLFAELGAALVLFDRRLARFFLTACAAMHLGIVMTAGIFFWKWILVDAAMIWYCGSLWTWNGSDVSIDRRAAVALPVATFMFALSHFATTGILFAWWDTSHSQYFTYQAETESGESYTLDPRYFVPYDIMFVQSRFYYVLHRPILPGTYGVTHSYPTFRDLRDASVDALPEIYERHAVSFFNPALQNKLGRFIQRYAASAAQRGRKGFLPSWLSTPYHFQTTFPEDHYDGQSKIDVVHVYFERHFFDGAEIRQLERTEVMTIPIPEARR